ncbi:MAG: type ISP restriction/modification enzyme, partial [Verrucomicrobiota bacterium]
KESLDHWRARWSGVFRHRIGHVINTSDMLAEAMAVLAKRIRDAAQTLIDRETDNGPLRKLHAAFKLNLIHDLTEEGFADTYAQTITYGLLTAAISRTEMSEGRKGTALVASNISDMVPVTNPFLKEMLQTFLHAGGRKGGIDFDELGVQDVVELLRGEKTDLPAILRDFGNKTRGDDPVIHFYEHFLNAYNRALRIQRGVFYTPQPVVSYIVRSVHELLQTEFGLADGLADTTTWGEMLRKHPDLKLPPLTDEPGEKRTISPDEMFVQILDPATGTATFLVEVIDVIHQHLETKWEKSGAVAMPSIPHLKSNIQNWSDFWNEYVPKSLLPRLHAFELMMAPYAIAHMKIGLKLAETGYRFGTDERARIYLTNALEPWQKSPALPDFDALAHEAAAVNEIKRHKRFTVVIGNPPYAGISSNMTEYAQRIVDAYKFVDGGALNERKLWLQDDYVKFIRKAQTTIETTNVGVFGYITNHGFLDNPTFRGMRQSLMETFPRLCVLDLHGNANKKERSPDGSVDKPVFDIKQGVAICLATRGGGKPSVAHSEIWGTRESKYQWLVSHSASQTIFGTLAPDSPYYFFKPHGIESRAEYDEGWRIPDMFPLNTVGFVTARDALTIQDSEDEMWKVVERFVSLSEEGARTEFDLGKDARDWRVVTAQNDIRKSGPTKKLVQRILYRPFDFRFSYYTGNSRGFYASPCSNVMKHMIAGKNLALCFNRREELTVNYSHFLATRLITEHGLLSSKTTDSQAPLYLLAKDEDDAHLFAGTGSRPNLGSPFLAALAKKLNLRPSGDFGLPSGLMPEDIFHYAYAVFHSPGYRSRYAEFLKIDFPRLPLTGNLELFRALARLGGELTALHLLESPKLDQPTTEFIGKSNEVVRIGWSDNTVWIDAPAKKKDVTQAPGSSGFRGVSEAVWNFHIGGYQVCQKWLKDRKGRTLTDEDIAHYHKIVISLTETIRLMAEIDEVIETHGGWPGAFAGATEDA